MKDYKSSLLNEYSAVITNTINNIYIQFTYNLLTQILFSIQEAKNSLKSKKWKYYEASKELFEEEKTAIFNFQDSFKSGSDTFQSSTDNLLKLKAKCENYSEIYKYELVSIDNIIYYLNIHILYIFYIIYFS